MSTYVCYHLPSDRDDPEHPNAFLIPKSAEDITLKDVKQAFPLPGSYHFRFKVKFDSGSYWIDCVDDAASVPLFGSRRIVAKVLRLTWTNGQTGLFPDRPANPPSPVKPSQQVSKPDAYGDLFSTTPATTQYPGPAKVAELDLFS